MDARTRTLQPESEDRSTTSDGPKDTEDDGAVVPHPGSPWRHVDGNLVDPFLPLPNVALDHTAKELLAHNFRSPSLRVHRDDWFTVGLCDPASLYQVLANAALHLDGLRLDGPLRQSKLATNFYLIAIASVRKRLAILQERGLLNAVHDDQQDADTVREIDGLIGATSGFTCWSDNITSRQQFVMHRNGMVQLVKARMGGLDALEGHLRATISWVELRGCYMYDTPPRFAISPAWVLKSSTEQAELCPSQFAESPAVAEIRAHWSEHFPSQAIPAWLEALSDLDKFCAFVNTDLQRASARLNGELLLEIPMYANIAVHRLLRMPQQTLLHGALGDANHGEESVASTLAEACRLAMLLFIALIWRLYGVTPTPTQCLVEKQFNLLLSSWPLVLSQVHLSGLAHLLVWILCITIFEADTEAVVLTENTHEWLISALQELVMTAGMSMHNKDDVETALKRTLWLDCVLDEKVECLGKVLEQQTARRPSPER